MGRRKTSMEFICKRRSRIGTFTKRKEGIQKKAEELSVLCGVGVALVVAAAEGDGAAAADVWESRDGVLARYRALAPEARAGHTHRAYLETELGKEEAKLARVRQAGPRGLDRWDKALDEIATAEEAQGLLDAIDAAIRAADDRQRALGMPVDGEEASAGVVLEGIVPLNFAAGVDDAYCLPQAPGGTSGQAMAVWGDNGFQPGAAANMQPGGRYGFQQCNCGNCAGVDGYTLQMGPDMYGASSSNNNGRLATDQYQRCYFGTSTGYQTQQVLGWGAAQPNPAAMYWSTDEPRHDMVPVNYPSAESALSYMEAPEAYGAQGGGGVSFTMGASGNFINATTPAALSLAMGTGGGNFINNAPPTAPYHTMGTGGGNFINNAPPAAPYHTIMGGTGGGNFINNAPPAAPSQSMGGTGDNFTNPAPAQSFAMSYGGDLTLANAGRYATQWQPAQQPQSAVSGQHSSFEQLHYLSDLEDTQLHL